VNGARRRPRVGSAVGWGSEAPDDGMVRFELPRWMVGAVLLTVTCVVMLAVAWCEPVGGAS
jgi:hypothetical protein